MSDQDLAKHASSQKVYDTSSNRTRIKIWAGIMVSIWSLSIVVSFLWNDQQVRTLIMDQAGSELRASFYKDLTFRQWATKHGGVYVPVTEETQPDPYIDYIPERDVITPSGRKLTLINPALMVRMFNEMAKKNSNTEGHISSLHPLNPGNKPDAWEAEALKKFELDPEGLAEITGVSAIKGEPYLRLIHVLKMTEKCLACHHQQGYKLDDVAGGVSVSVPLIKLEAAADIKIGQIGIGHSILWILGVAAILLGRKKLNQGLEESRRAYEALGENETRTRNILSTSLDAVITIDGSDMVTGWSKQAEVIFGWSEEEILGGKLAEFVIPERYREMHLTGIANYIKTGEGSALNKRMEVVALKKNGEEFPVELTIAPIIVAGKPAFSSFIRDISEHKKAAAQISNDYHSQRVISSVLEISTRSIPFEEKLEQSLEAILSTPWLVLQGTGVIFVVDKKSNRLVMAAQSGVSEMIQEKCKTVEMGECLCGQTAEKNKIIHTTCLDGNHTIHYDGMKEHGHYCVPISSENELVGVLNLYLNHGHKKSDEEQNFLKMISNTLGNMFHQQRNEEKLQHYAFYDELTDLPNRTLFIDRVDQCIKHASRNKSYLYAVLFLDLDRFKNINDSLGHAVGDQVLCDVAERLNKCVRDVDTVARLGGDEFAILLDEIADTADAYHTASRIHQELVNPLQLERHEVFTSASIGVVPGLSKYETHSELLRDADIAMYRAKQKGNGRTEVFDGKMHAHAVNMLNIEMELRRALDRNEFCIYLQPIISVEGEVIVGFEALLRWNNPERGLVEPDNFIPIAEETGLINEIGLWVLQEACRQIKVWNDKYPDYKSLYVSVNLSPVQFLKKDFISRIDNYLSSVTFDVSNLRLEITENILMENPEAAAKILNDLKSRNIRLYLDDFGTGYSSLSYIHNFPFDTLKIDRSFVTKMETGREHIGMVKTIIAVAKNFNMDVIAEGVETIEQLMILKDLGCRNIQGYYFSKPVTIDEAEKMLTGSDIAQD
ncbi:MAG: EAL domain-containing protein [Gammaproteobacteria bacterium]|nr:EAL domain-containing protein [Gammaproteobacteria bacterium]